MENLKKLALLSFLLIVSILEIHFVFAYENTEFGFTIDPPPMWDLNEDTGVNYMPVVFVDSYTGASINIVLEEVRGSLWDNIEGTKVILESSFDDYTLVYEASRVIGGLDCYELVSTWNQFDFLIKAKQVVFVEDGTAYTITCSALESEFDNFLLDFENSITSFRLTSEPDTLPINLDAIILGGIVFIAVIVILLLLFVFRTEKEIQTSIQQPDSPYVSPSSDDEKSNVDSVPKYCRKCGSETKSDTVFCENCGKKLID